MLNQEESLCESRRRDTASKCPKMAQAFPQQQQQQQQSSYMGGQLPEYAQQPRYGGVPHAAYGVLPYAAVPPAQYLPQGMPAPDGGYDAEALALAQGMNNMVLAPGQQQMVQIQQGQYYAPHQQQRMPAGYGPPAGYGYPPQQGPGNAGLRGPPLGQQQQYQQHPGQQGMGPPMGMNGHHHMQDMRGGPMQNGRGGPPGPRMMGPGPGPRGMGMQQQQQQQMQRGGGRKKVQRGLEDNVRRTVYISYIDQQVRATERLLCCADSALSDAPSARFVCTCCLAVPVHVQSL